MRLPFSLPLHHSVLALAIALGWASDAASARRPTPGRRAAVQARGRLILGRNLVTNGDAEIDSDGWAAGWKPEETLRSETWGHTAGEWDRDVPGAPEGGEHYFRLPVPDGQESVAAVQWVRLERDTSAFDRGEVGFVLSGWLGGIVDGHGTARLEADFLDASGRSLLEVATDPIANGALPRPRVGLASLDERSVTGDVPPGARRVRIRLVAVNAAFAQCPNCSALGLADRLSLVLARKTAEP